MKQLKTVLLFLIFPLMTTAQELIIQLNTNWQFRQANKADWHPAEVPGTVHTDLLKNEINGRPILQNE